jgi:hypothetical protein
MQTNNIKERRREALAALGSTTNLQHQHSFPGAFAVHPSGAVVPQRPDVIPQRPDGDDDSSVSVVATDNFDDGSTSRYTEVAYSAVLVEATITNEDDISYQYEMERNSSYHSEVIEGKPWVDPTLTPDHDDGDDHVNTTDGVMNHSKPIRSRRFQRVLLALLLMAMFGGIAYAIYNKKRADNKAVATEKDSTTSTQPPSKSLDLLRSAVPGGGGGGTSTSNTNTSNTTSTESEIGGGDKNASF